MFAEFRAQYPTGSLVSKLVEGAKGQYIIRVSVKVDGRTVATGMAAAATLEEAEDRARIRALEAFGFVMEDGAGQVYLLQPGDRDPQRAWLLTAVEATAESGTIAPGPLQPLLGATREPEAVGSSAEPLSEQVSELPLASPSEVASDGASDAASGRASEPVLESPAAPAASAGSAGSAGLDTPDAPDAPDEDWLRDGPELTPPPPMEEAPAIAPPPPPSPAPMPFDLSDVIAKTDTLIKQLHWTRKQGSQHLQATYGKRTRAELTDEELMEFLRYLEALAAAG